MVVAQRIDMGPRYHDRRHIGRTRNSPTLATFVENVKKVDIVGVNEKEKKGAIFARLRKCGD